MYRLLRRKIWLQRGGPRSVESRFWGDGVFSILELSPWVVSEAPGGRCRSLLPSNLADLYLLPTLPAAAHTAEAPASTHIGFALNFRLQIELCENRIS